MLKLRLRRGDRGILIGQSGSGKTTLGLELVRAMPRPVLIVDTKWSETIGDMADDHDWRISEGVPPLRRRDKGVYVWRPSPDDLVDPGLLDAELDNLVRNRRICSVYIDELYQLHKAGRPGPGVVGLYTRGREMGFTTLASSQRPAWVSQFCLTEASHYFVMRLLQQQDRKRMGEMMGAPIVQKEALPPHYFWYARQGSEPILVKPLDIAGKEDNSQNTAVLTGPNYRLI